MCTGYHKIYSCSPNLESCLLYHHQLQYLESINIKCHCREISMVASVIHLVPESLEYRQRGLYNIAAEIPAVLIQLLQQSNWQNSSVSAQSLHLQCLRCKEVLKILSQVASQLQYQLGSQLPSCSYIPAVQLQQCTIGQVSSKTRITLRSRGDMVILPRLQ